MQIHRDAYVLGQGFWLLPKHEANLEKNFFLYEMKPIYQATILKNFFDINEMNETEISLLSTEAKYSKKSFIYDFLSSMRQKINDPLGKRKKP